jgi:hypothetical protein
MYHALKHDEQQSIRFTAAKILGKIGDKDCIPCLLEALINDTDDSVRREAAFSLSYFGRQEAIPELKLALSAGFLEARRNGIKSLARLKVEEPLWNIFQSEVTGSGWRTAGIELGKLGITEVIPGLFKALADLGYESSASGEIIDLLSKLADSKLLSRLITALEEPEKYTADPYFCNRIALVLVKCRPEIVADQLPNLISVIGSQYVQQLLWVIPTIQANCQFYNYDIAQSPPTPEGRGHPTDGSASLYIESVKELTIMSDQPPIFNQTNPTIGVNYAAGGSNPKIIQKVQNTQQSSPEAALDAVVQIIRALEQKYTFVQDEQQALNIIDAEFKEIKAHQPPQWQNLMNVKRLYNGGKKAAVKVAEHFAEENVWGKGFVAFLEGASEDVK